MKRIILSCLIVLVLASGAGFSKTEVPYLSGRVNDYAQILSEDTKVKLTENLKLHEEQTGDQIAVLTIPSLDGENIEDYANRVFNTWELGQKDRDNGILIVVAPNDRRMRIEVGYGLEPTLTDGMAGQIIRNIMTPHFKNSDYNAGIMDGTLAVISVLEGEQLPDMVNNESGGDSGDSFFDGPDLSFMERILIGSFIFGIIGLFTVIGVLTPGMGWFLYFFLIPFWAMFPIVVLGAKGAFYCLVTYVIGFPIAKLSIKNTSWYKKAKKDMKKKGKASIGGFTLSSSGSSGSSWSSGGSSFSGGGGSSGGGGASGSW